MRCLHVKVSLDPRLGGSVQAVLDLCQAARSVGDDCQVATIASAGFRSSTKHRTNLEVEIHEFSPSWPARLGNSWPLTRWLTKHITAFDLVEIHDVFTVVALSTAILARCSGVPYTVRPHGSLDPFDLKKHRTAKRLLSPLFSRVLLRSAAAICFTSDEELRCAQVYGSTARKYSTPLPVHPATLPGDRNRFRRAIAVQEATFVALFLSRIDYKKGLGRILEAVRAIRSGGGDVELVIAGDGDAQFLFSIHAMVDQLELTDVVHFLGFLTGQEKADAFAGADGFFLPSDNENFGIAVIEALYAGTPVVVSRCVHIASQLSALGAALVVEPNMGSTQEAMRRLMYDADLRSRLSEAGLRAARVAFSPASIARRELDNRLQILGRRNRATTETTL